MSYAIAIPSHRRAELIVERTLRYLDSTDVDMSRVTVFVSDDEDQAAYAKTLEAHVARGLYLVRTGTSGATAKFNAIHEAYPLGKQVFVIEDDVEELIELVEPGKNAKRRLVELDALIRRGFDEVPLGGLWGIAPHSNAFYFTGKVKHGLFLVVAHAFGFVATGDPTLRVTCGSKTDYERTCLYFMRYGEVVRLDYAGVKTKSYTQAGGMQASLSREQRARVEAEACATLTARYPILLAPNTKKSAGGPFNELSFLRCKLSLPALRAWQKERDEKAAARK